MCVSVPSITGSLSCKKGFMLTTDTPAQVKATNGNKLTPWKMSHCNFLLLLPQTLTKEKYIYVCNGGQLVGTVQINLTRLTLVAVAFSLFVSASASRVRSGFETRYMSHTHIYIYIYTLQEPDLSNVQLNIFFPTSSSPLLTFHMSNLTGLKSLE